MTRMHTTLRALVAAGLLAVSGAAQARVDKADISPPGVRGTVAAKGHTLLLLTSPDPKCKYCTGQGELFDGLARTHAGDLRLRRVQWSPWHKFPQRDLFPRMPGGIPAWQVFHQGEIVAEHLGSFPDAAALAKFVDDAVQGRLPKPAEPTAAPSPAAAPARAAARRVDPPLSEADRQALSVMVRRDLARRAFERCGKANPGDRDHYDEALRGYEARHRADIDHGMKLLFARTDPGSGREMDPIVDAEAGRLRAEAPINSATPDGCRQLAQALAR